MSHDQKEGGIFYRRIRELPFSLQLFIFSEAHVPLVLKHFLEKSFFIAPSRTELLNLVVTRTREEAGLFQNAHCLSCALMRLPSTRSGEVMASLKNFASVLLREPVSLEVSLGELLNEYDERGLQGRRCVRLLEYVGAELFDFDRIVAVTRNWKVMDYLEFELKQPERPPPDPGHHPFDHGPFADAFAAEAFCKRWHRAFLSRRKKYARPDYGYMTLLTETDLSPFWSRA